MPHFIEEDIPARVGKEAEVEMKMDVDKDVVAAKGGEEGAASTRRHWMMGKEAFERRMPHHDGIKALWETKWKFPVR